MIAAGPWSRALAEAAGVALPLEPRKGQLVRLRRRAARRALHPPQGRRGRLPGLGRERRRGAAGDDGARDDVGRRRARGLEPRAPRLRPLRRRRRQRRHARAAFALMPGLRGLRARRRLGRAAPVAAGSPARDRAVAARRRGCGSPPGTRAPAWRSAPSPAGWSPSSTRARPRSSTRRRSRPIASDPEQSDGPAVSRPARRCVC